MSTQEQKKAYYDLVAHMHRNQIRKYTKEPYTVHLNEVADMACKHSKDIPYTWEIAIGHDLFEDTECKIEELNEFLLTVQYTPRAAAVIVHGILELTDFYTHERFINLNRAERKILEAQRLGRVSPQAQTIKYADLISNSLSIVLNDPGFGRTYVSEKRTLLEHMRQGNGDLYILCCAKLVEAESILMGRS